MQVATTPQPMGKCLREVMKQIQRGDSGPLSNLTLRPQPSQEDRPESCEDLQRVEDWLATDGARFPPRLNAYRALKPLVATNTLTATSSQHQRDVRSRGRREAKLSAHYSLLGQRLCGRVSPRTPGRRCYWGGDPVLAMPCWLRQPG